MRRFSDPLGVVRGLSSHEPVTCLRPHAARRAARWFKHSFPGRILFAVKANPEPAILDALVDGGIECFDVASLAEIQLIAQRYPAARMCYMHTVKSRESIGRAYHEFGIRDFALDCEAELDKILGATGGADDLGLYLRLTVSNRYAEMDLSGKFGCEGAAAVSLLRRARGIAARLGVCFHVGSQCMDPAAYTSALERVHGLVAASGVMLDVIDIGGGFPSAYPGMVPPPLSAYVGTIADAVSALSIAEGCELWCEPGRALVAEAASTLVRVELRKGDCLYINDGTYGSLFDAGFPGFVYPARAIRSGRPADDGGGSGAAVPYRLFGPTCDSLDRMAGPFLLPADLAEGDYVEIGGTGAYGAALRTRFNGFGEYVPVIVEDPPQLSLYGPEGVGADGAPPIEALASGGEG